MKQKSSTLAAVAIAAAFAFAGGLQAATITLTAPEDGATYDTHSPCVKEFFANFDKRGVKPERPPEERDYFVFNEYTEDLLKRCTFKESPEWKPFTWETDGELSDFTVEFSETPDFAHSIVENPGLWEKDGRGGAAIRPHFLKIGIKYFWRVKAKDAAGKEVVSKVRTFTTAGVPPRMIGVPGNNFRDLGGGTNADGVKIRQGLLYRGMQPFVNKPKEFVKNFYIDNLGIKTDLDIRGETERAGAIEHGEANLEEFGVKYFCYTMEDYHLYHDRCLQAFPKIMAILADRKNYPVYTHCMVGSDRTGTLFAVLDGILGRDDRYIYDDYELASLAWWLPRFRYSRKGSELFGYLDPTSPKWGGPDPRWIPDPKVNGKNIRENAELYLRAIGVPQEHIDAFRAIMLEK